MDLLDSLSKPLNLFSIFISVFLYLFYFIFLYMYALLPFFYIDTAPPYDQGRCCLFFLSLPYLFIIPSFIQWFFSVYFLLYLISFASFSLLICPYIWHSRSLVPVWSRSTTSLPMDSAGLTVDLGVEMKEVNHETFPAAIPSSIPSERTIYYYLLLLISIIGYSYYIWFIYFLWLSRFTPKIYFASGTWFYYFFLTYLLNLIY